MIRKIVSIMLIACFAFSAVAVESNEREETDANGQLTELNRLINEQRLLNTELKQLLDEQRQLISKQKDEYTPSRPQVLLTPLPELPSPPESEETDADEQLDELNRLVTEQRQLNSDLEQLLDEQRQLIGKQRDERTPPRPRVRFIPPPAPEYAQFSDAWIVSGSYNGGYWIQVGAFQNSETVQRLKAALQSRNFSVDASLTVIKDGKTLRRVRIGPYSRSDAEIILKIIRKTVVSL
jgi:cell division septation protein DedD